MKKENKIHFIGIGGIGMSGLAVLASNAGYTVSGSDIQENSQLNKLKNQGIDVYIPHCATNVNGVNRVVFSTAIKEDNVEMMAARERGVELLHRSELLGQFVAEKQAICVSGTHGKTTTTAMISHIMTESGWRPTCLIGGNYPLWQSNVRVDSSPWLVIEADESDGSLLNYKPYIALITNVDDDHLDHYGSLENIKSTFENFLTRVTDNGSRIVCGDDDYLFELSKERFSEAITYGFKERNTFSIGKTTAGARCSSFEVFFRNIFLGHLMTPLSGEHNLLNSLGAMVTCLTLGIPFKKIYSSLASFRGVSRRAEILFQDENITVMDDYAHHPTEITATLRGLKKSSNGNRIVVAFQPHRYSRTQALYQELANALLIADQIFICPLYPAGEKPIKGVSEALIHKAMPLGARKDVKIIPDIKGAHHQIARNLKRGDTFVSMGAGNVREVAENLAALYSGKLDLAV